MDYLIRDDATLCVFYSIAQECCHSLSLALANSHLESSLNLDLNSSQNLLISSVKITASPPAAWAMNDPLLVYHSASSHHPYIYRGAEPSFSLIHAEIDCL